MDEGQVITAVVAVYAAIVSTLALLLQRRDKRERETTRCDVEVSLSSNVWVRVLSKALERANERLQEAGEPPLPALTPHGLRRSSASLLYGIGEPPPVVMQELGHTDPSLALSIYAQAMRRDDGENDRLRALVEGSPIGSNGSGGEFAADAEHAARAL